MENKDELQNPKPVIPSVEHNYKEHQAPKPSPETIHKASDEDGRLIPTWILLLLILILLISWLLFLT